MADNMCHELHVVSVATRKNMVQTLNMFIVNYFLSGQNGYNKWNISGILLHAKHLEK